MTDMDIINKWLESDDGIAWEEGVYRDAFDDGFENARAIFGGLEIPDEIIPTMTDDEMWKVYGNER